ncbi:hypothetical protein CKO28_02435 [Rhodovibrio sodomensis]|uniref:Type II secretion system protein GspF domain-containing protein n=1 Tax=Rhodovibrio sodomensis TaxID=1088 RepID=A0ABS1D9I5_9PROT|nr:type II secretion system F family protein [Rhodovibrio sodomensis]MBK1666899.1 hypothetical protein [Rhodovibrio sodomensis]
MSIATQAANLGVPVEEIIDLLARKSCDRKRRLKLYRQLHTYLINEVPIHKALDILHDIASDNGERPYTIDAWIIDVWREGYQRAASFSDAIRDWAPSSEHQLIMAGEKSGQLEQALADVISLAETASKQTGAVIGGLIYPSLLTVFLIGIMLMFSYEVLPQWAKLLPPERWTGTPALVWDISVFVRSYLIFVLAGLAGLLAASLWSLPRLTGPLRQRLEKLPPWNLYRRMQGGAFLLSMSAMMRADVHQRDALLQLRETASPYLRERVDAALRWVLEGYNIGDALYRSGYEFPDRQIITDLRGLAKLKGVESALERIARQWVQDGVDKVRAIMGLVKVVMIVAVGITLIIFWTGLYGIYEQGLTQIGM